MKRFIALVLSLIMAMSLCAPAWGDEALEGAGTEESPYLVDTNAELVAAIEKGGYVKLEDSFVVADTLEILAGKTINLDLAGFEISGNGISRLIHIANTATLNISDNSDEKSGRIELTTTGNGSTVNVEGVLNLYSGEISFVDATYSGISYAVEVQPNAWGTEYTEETLFHMHDGLLSSYTYGVRVASYSSEKYKNISAKFIMDDGAISSGYASVFVQQPNDVYDKLTVEINDGDLFSYYDAVQVYGPAATSVVGDVETPMSVTISGGTFEGTFSVQNTISTDKLDYAVTGGTFTSNTVEPYVADGYAATEKDGVYTVAIVQADNNKVETEVKVDVAAPSISVLEIDTSGMKDEEKKAVEEAVEALDKPDAVEFDDTALKMAAAEVTTTVKNEVSAEEATKALADENITVVDEEKVTIVVQPYYDVKVEAITVDDTGAATIALDITPMYQTVVTTADVANNEPIVLPEDEGTTNAVAVGAPKEMKVTKPVEITIAIPDALVTLAANNGNKLFVTHTKDDGTKYVYEAAVDATAKTATFLNPNGFSSFSISTVDSTAVTMNGMNYVDLQSAINDLRKDSVITVLNGEQVAKVSGNTSFTVVVENGATAKITAADGYVLYGPDNNGKYTVREKYTGGYYVPTNPSTDKTVKSADTFDAGIALYVGVSVMGAIGSVALSKKRED